MTRERLAGVLLAVGLAVGAGVPAWGQASPGNGSDRVQQLQREQRLRELDQFNLDRRVRANEMIPVGQRALVDYGGLLTLGYLNVRDADGTNPNKGARLYELVGYARVNLDGVHEGFVRGRYTYTDYLSEDDSFDGRGSRENRDKLDRAYYRFDLGRYMQAYEGKSGDPGLSIQAGRDLVYWANGLVLGQRLDGVIADFSSGPFSLQAIAGITPEDTVDFDASRPDFDIDTRRGFYGALASLQAAERHRPFVYVLSQRDYNDRDPFPVGPGFTPGTVGEPLPARFRYDSWYVGAGSTGNLTDRLLYGVEAAYQGGQSLASNAVPDAGFFAVQEQTENTIQAWAVNARLEYLVPDTRQTRISLEQTLASGDPNRISSSRDTVGGDLANTNDNAFNGFGLINPGLAFTPNLSNLSITRLGISTFPLPQNSLTRRLQVGLDVFVYFKIRREAVIDERTTGFDPDSSFNRYVGIEPDLFMNWQLTSDLTLVARYGIFFPGNALVANDEPRQFLYLGMTYAF